MITPIFVLVLLCVWALTRPRPNHSPTLGTVAAEWAKALVRRDDDDDDEGDDDDDDDEGDASDGEDDDDGEGEDGRANNWSWAVSPPEPGHRQTIGPLPAPPPAKVNQPQLKGWQEYALDAKLKGYRPGEIKRSIREMYGVSPATFDRFVTRMRGAGQW